ncbi:hypothetical protein A3I40_01890 [Candidatus Uhrbacteria bacterium RIFCSPLOWO2_02_FULL_48_12]|uniref:EamA domain-containing protein n=1 Tax=Candidatus Uhrbacteria bacterium RIFCSPLOWO2_02_FULL_48_12 TaxID=1802407 RepID=A0A1F7V6C5_9BACT|nr:MAG: hypothetical protein A3I40_01890 [Candidatus Uhrbacteria bacterium RIFCSPLOWO2_02_FULL_48_12]
MPWLMVVLAGHLSNAGAFVIDKILLQKTLRHPTVYVFYIGVLGILAFALLPFGKFSVPSAHVIVQSAVSGVTFMAALLCFFTALQKGETTRVVPLFGALIPIWTLIFASIFLGEWLWGSEWYGIILLIVGAFLISYEPSFAPTAITKSLALLIVAAAGLFALSSTMLKAVFIGTDFINGFLWTRSFAFLSVLPLAFYSPVRSSIFHSAGASQPAERPNVLFFIGQAMGSLGFLLLAWGTKLAPRVAIVNALQGVQYAFLFLLILMISSFAPRLIKESLSPSVIVQKTIAILILAAGLVLVA